MKHPPIQPGDPVPRFSLNNQHGAPVSVERFLGKPFIIYFYPKDDTPGCTAESCAFRDVYEEFRSLEAEIIGISADNPVSHQAFAKKYRLPFILLCDEKNEVRRLFGVSTGLFNWLADRVTYVVDAEGIVRHVFQSRLEAKRHVREALEALKRQFPA